MGHLALMFVLLPIRIFNSSRGLRMRSLLLLGKYCVEHGLLNVWFQLAACRINERISTPASKLRVLRLHVVLRWMISNLDITRERTHQLEGPVELINDRRRHDIGRAEAAVDYDIVGLASLFGLRRPRRAAACVTGREMRDERRASQRHRFSVAQHFVDR